MSDTDPGKSKIVDKMQMDEVESTGRAGEYRSFKDKPADPTDLTGPAGDPAEGKR